MDQATAIKELEAALAKAQSGAMDNMRMMELFTGVDDSERDFYAYIAVPPSKYMEYRTRLERGEEIDLEAYGEIIEHGYSALPPADIRKKMSDMGFKHGLEEELNERIAKQA